MHKWTFDQECTNAGVFLKDGERTGLNFSVDENDLSTEDLELVGEILRQLNK